MLHHAWPLLQGRVDVPASRRARYGCYSAHLPPCSLQLVWLGILASNNEATAVRAVHPRHCDCLDVLNAPGKLEDTALLPSLLRFRCFVGKLYFCNTLLYFDPSK